MLRISNSVVLCVMFVAFAACAGPDDMREIRDGQREVRAKLADLEKKIDQLAARPAAPAPQVAARPAPAQPAKLPDHVFDIPTGNSPFKGPKDAPVVLVEFSDFECPFCSKVPPLIDEAMEAYPDKLKFVFKQFPLTAIHKSAMGAAEASLAANKQGKFWEMHDKMFENQRALQPDDLKKYAQEIGLDMAKFEKDMASPEVEKEIQDDRRVAQQSGVRGTPSVFVNGKRLNDRSIESLKLMISDELAGSKKG